MTNEQLLQQILEHPTVAATLTGKRTRQGDEIAWCVFHDDGNGKPPHEANLRIGPKGYVCHACKAKGGLRKLAQHLGIGFDTKDTGVVATWDYCTPDGSKKLFEKCRYERPQGKTYALRRSAPADWRDCPHRAECQKEKRDCFDGWIWSLRKKPCSPAPPPVLYNQPMLAHVGDQPVCIAEGEACCDALVELGFIAVCNPYGAGEWRREYSDALRSLQVLIWVDADKAGRDHGQLVARSLWGQAKSIKIVDVYPDRDDGSDVADVVAERRKTLASEGKTNEEINRLIREELQALIAGTPEWTPPQALAAGKSPSSSSSSLTSSDGDDDDQRSPIELCTLPKPGPRRWIIEGLVPERRTTVLYGDGGLAKSLIAMLVGDHVARGQDLFGLRVEPGRVLYLDWELDEEEQARRAYLVAAGLGHPSPAPGLFYKQMAFPLTKALTDITTWLADLSISLLILDSFGLATIGDPTAAKDVVPLLRAVSCLPCTSLFIDHIRNLQPGDRSDDLKPFGSVYKFHIGRSVIRVVRASSDDVSLSVLLRQTKSNFNALREPLGLRISFEEDRISFEQLSPSAAVLATAHDRQPAAERVYQALVARGQASPQQLAETTNLNEGTVKNQLTALRRQQKVTLVSKGLWVPTSASSSSSLSLYGDDDGNPAEEVQRLAVERAKQEFGI